MPDCPDLEGLEAIVAEKAVLDHRRRCRACQHPEVLAALDKWRKAKAKHPEKYRGLSWDDLLRWSGAEQAGLDRDNIKRHYRAVDPAAWGEMNA